MNKLDERFKNASEKIIKNHNDNEVFISETMFNMNEFDNQAMADSIDEIASCIHDGIDVPQAVRDRAYDVMRRIAHYHFLEVKAGLKWGGVE